jgi:hypothetical protein
MLRKHLGLMLAALLLALLVAPEVQAWGAYHSGYTHVGYGGVQHYGSTTAVGPYGSYSGSHYGSYGAGGSSHYGSSSAYGSRGGYEEGYHYGTTGYGGGYAAGGYHYGTTGSGGYGYAAGAYRAW